MGLFCKHNPISFSQQPRGIGLFLLHAPNPDCSWELRLRELLTLAQSPLKAKGLNLNEFLHPALSEALLALWRQEG